MFRAFLSRAFVTRAFGMNTRRTGSARHGCDGRWIRAANSALAGESDTVSPSTPAVRRPALCCVTCRTLISVFDQLRSINFCKLRTRFRSPSRDAVKIRCRSRRTFSSQVRQSTASQSRSLPSGPFAPTAASTTGAELPVIASNMPFGSSRSSPVVFTDSPGPRQHPFESGHHVPYPASYPGPGLEEATVRPGFLLPFGHRHSLLGPSCPRQAPRPSSRSAHRTPTSGP